MRWTATRSANVSAPVRRDVWRARWELFSVGSPAVTKSCGQRLQTRSREIRSHGRGRAVHARLPGALAELQSGFELWLQFALETGAISIAERMELEQRCEQAFRELSILQARYHQGSDPAPLFCRPFEGCPLLRPRACGGPSRLDARISGRMGLAAQAGRPGMGSAGCPHRVVNGRRSILGADH